MSQEALATSAIEGERLDLTAVRTSVARWLGVGKQDGPNAPRNADGLFDTMDDSVKRRHEPLTHERLLVDLLLARDSGDSSRLFRTSQRPLKSRLDYYANLVHA